ncbi:hypothetical protein EVAR_10423_1 [Eumeta japonica]|uniref:Uncharacterized protein n=1 Tax=Eumeta variegata TaxID=151549 RepID=A0A4C1UE19_EUMVA|nr:hypothetical protein EVAR_10423_1 [Eumeta japonica]
MHPSPLTLRRLSNSKVTAEMNLSLSMIVWRWRISGCVCTASRAFGCFIAPRRPRRARGGGGTGRDNLFRFAPRPMHFAHAPALRSAPPFTLYDTPARYASDDAIRFLWLFPRIRARGFYYLRFATEKKLEVYFLQRGPILLSTNMQKRSESTQFIYCRS